MSVTGAGKTLMRDTVVQLRQGPRTAEGAKYTALQEHSGGHGHLHLGLIRDFTGVMTLGQEARGKGAGELERERLCSACVDRTESSTRVTQADLEGLGLSPRGRRVPGILVLKGTRGGGSITNGSVNANYSHPHSPNLEMMQ